jgi:hypothetical protein
MVSQLISNGSRLVILGIFVLSLALAATATSSARAQGSPDGKRIVGYFIEWGIYGRGYTVKDVVTSGSAAKLTHINYAFGNVAPGPDGKIVCKIGDAWADYQKPWSAEESVDGMAIGWDAPLRGNFQQLRALKALHPNIKVLVALGGWTWSSHFSDAALTPESRGARQVLRRPVYQGRPAGRRCGRAGRGRRRLRRHRHRLGVPGRGGRQQQLPARGHPELYRAAGRVPQPA